MAKDQDDNKVKANEALVGALVHGNKKLFEDLLAGKVEGYAKADIAALDSANLQPLLRSGAGEIKDFFNASAATKNPAGSREILDDIYSGKHTQDTSRINLPAMASYFNHEKLMDNLIDDQKTKPRDFNEEIGKRRATALSLASCNVKNGEPDLSSKIMQNAERVGLDLTKVRTGLPDAYSMGDTKKTQAYLDQISQLSPTDVETIKSSTLTVMLKGSDDPQVQQQTRRILGDIAKSPDGAKVMADIGVAIGNMLGDIKSADRQMFLNAVNELPANERNSETMKNVKAPIVEQTIKEATAKMQQGERHFGATPRSVTPIKQEGLSPRAQPVASANLSRSSSSSSSTSSSVASAISSAGSSRPSTPPPAEAIIKRLQHQRPPSQSEREAVVRRMKDQAKTQAQDFVAKHRPGGSGVRQL
jgi:hypothetical protein